MEGEESPPHEQTPAAGEAVPPELPAGEFAVAPPPETPTERTYPVEFTARAGEYFRIWIVNLALSVITLGIYSAWATVRKRRYFHGHTRISGDYFEYLGRPIAILKGRIIAVVFFGFYSYSENISYWLKGALFLVLVVGAPWLIVRSLAFNAFNTRYRNIRFAFHGTYSGALKVIAVNAFFVIGSLGLLYPSFKARLTRFVAGNHAYGTTRFETGSLTRSFYGIYIVAWAVILGMFVIYGVVIAMGVGGGLALGIKPDQVPAWLPVALILPVYAVYFFAFAFLQAKLTNATWNVLTLGPVRFTARLRIGRLTWIYFSNVVAVLCSLGMATPWAVVRTMRYRAVNTNVIAAQGLDRFTAGESNPVSATGEEIGELFGIDISL
jgi:uncharacterized membrane protein YjgN (DUF898 family)